MDEHIVGHHRKSPIVSITPVILNNCSQEEQTPTQSISVGPKRTVVSLRMSYLG